MVLPLPVRPDQAQYLARREVQRDLLQHRVGRVVAERDRVQVDGERPGRQGRPARSRVGRCRRCGQGRTRPEQAHRPARGRRGALQILHLPRYHPQRPRHHAGVVEHQVGDAEGGPAVQVQECAKAESDREAERIHHQPRVDHERGTHGGLDLVAHEAPREAVELADHERLAGAGVDVLHAGQGLLQEAEQLAARLPGALPLLHADAAQGQQHGPRHHHVAGHDRAHPPVLAEHHRHHPDDHQRIADDLHREFGEVVAHQRDVAVHPLDHLAGRMVVVEAQIEAHRVAQQVGAQGVGGLPADAYAQQGGDHRDGVGQRRRASVGRSPPRQVGQRRAGGRRVDHVADDQRAQRLGAGARQQQHPQQRHGAAPAPQVVAQHAEQRRGRGGGGSVGHRSRKVRVSPRTRQPAAERLVSRSGVCAACTPTRPSGRRRRAD